MKTAIIYYSRHHENTKKLLDAISARHEVTLIDATKTKEFDLTGYDLIGFASGIYYSKFQKSVLEFAETFAPLVCKINSIWPVQVFGMADNRELIELSFAEYRLSTIAFFAE